MTVQRDILKFPPISQNSFRPAEAAEMMDSIVKDLRIQGKTDAIVVLDKKIQPEFKVKNDQKHAQEAVIAKICQRYSWNWILMMACCFLKNKIENKEN